MIDVMFILWIGQKGQCSRFSFFNFREIAHLYLRITFDGSSEESGNLLGCKLHVLFVL